MLHVHFSNRCELLAKRLLAELDAPTGSPFAAEQVIVPSAAVRRWLTLQIADARGICANVEFDYLARWLWRQTSRLLPGMASGPLLASDVMAWRVHAALGDAGFVAAHPRLATYLREADEVTRYELALGVAGVLDAYLAYRPEWLQAWAQGLPAQTGAASDSQLEDARWQAALWRRLAAEVGAPALAGGAAALHALEGVQPQQARAAGLPASVHVFALPAMPAHHLAWLQRIARLTQVHVYALNPCQAYWFDVVEGRRLSRLAAQGRAEHLEEGNRLLAAWGRQAQAQLHGLVDAAGPDTLDDEHFLPNEADTLLARVQNAILELAPIEPGSVRMSDDDRSIEVRVCHSMTRELEVLHDHLLGLLASGAVQHPSQVLVATPDLDAAAPLIDAVFGTAPPGRRIPYVVSGRARSSVNVPARTLLQLLALAQSRLAASEVFALLQQDIVARRFGLDADALEQLREWVVESGARWGLDAAHRASLDLPAHAEHTWSDALQRLYLGYALPAQVGEPFAELLPAGDAEGSEALALGALWQFVEGLSRLHAQLRTARPAQQWCELILGAIDDFMLAQGDERDDQRELVAAVRELAEAMEQGGLGQPDAPLLPVAVVRAALERQLDDPARGGVPTGGVTFTSMSSLRGLPFQVVCVIGLNDRAFPGAQRPPEFDLMALRPRAGDRQRRSDDRNVFLDLLLAARGSLYLSYTGRSVRDNARLVPSVLVSELLDELVPALADDPASPASRDQARRRLVVEHPLQPFAREAFEAGSDPRLRSFNQEMAQALRGGLRAASTAAAGPLTRVVDGPSAGDAGLQGVEAGEGDEGDEGDPHGFHDDAPPFLVAPLAPPGPAWQELTLANLARFFRNPARYWLERRLDVHLERSERDLEDDEPFVLDGLGRSRLADRLLGPLLEGAPVQAVRRLALAGRELPGGSLGQRLLELELDALARFAQVVRAHTATPGLPPLTFELDFELQGQHWKLAGSLADLRPQGLVRWRYRALRGDDVVGAWLAHLVLCQLQPVEVTPRTLWLSQDEPLDLAPVPGPRRLLEELIGLYRRGLCEPLEFFPKAAWALVGQGQSPREVRADWKPDPDKPWREGGDAACELAFRGRPDPLAGEFEALAWRVFGPVRESMGAAPGEGA